MEQNNSVINKARQGCRDAMRKLYESTISYAWFVARRYIKDDADIADVLQEAYTSVFKNIHTFDEERPFNPWLYAIVSRKCLNFIKGKKETALSLDVIKSHMADTESIIPEQWLEQQDKRRELLQIIDGLPDKQRMVITLFYFEQMDISEVAREMEIAEGTVKSHLFHGRKNMKNEIIAREEKAGMAYLRPAGVTAQLAKLYKLEAASAVVPQALSDAVWSVVIAADKAAIRHWFIAGVGQGYKHMLIVYDRMDYPDESDSPYYLNSAEAVYEALSDFRRDPMSEVMEIYDLTADMEEQLGEHRVWRLPALPDEEEGDAMPDSYPASGRLASGETRLQFMERKNAEFISIKYAEYFGALGAVSNPLHVFTDDSRERVHDICAYILEQTYVTKATVAAVYWFKPDGTASAHSAVIMSTDQQNDDCVLLPLPRLYSVDLDWRSITFDISYARGPDKYSPAYMHDWVLRSFMLTEDEEQLGMDSGTFGCNVDKESHEYYEHAIELKADKDKSAEDAAVYFYAAACRGHADAMFEFGNFWSAYKHDEKEAKQWFKLAALLGHKAAAQKVKLEDK